MAVNRKEFAGLLRVAHIAFTCWLSKVDLEREFVVEDSLEISELAKLTSYLDKMPDMTVMDGFIRPLLELTKSGKAEQTERLSIAEAMLSRAAQELRRLEKVDRQFKQNAKEAFQHSLNSMVAVLTWIISGDGMSPSQHIRAFTGEASDDETSEASVSDSENADHQSSSSDSSSS